MSQEEGLPVDPVIEGVFKNMKLKRTKRLMVLIIKDDIVTIEKMAKRKTNVEDCYGYFPETECRYIVWDVEAQNTGSNRPYSKLYFITWCPQLAPMKDKTLYTSQRLKRIADVIKGATDVHAVNMEEVRAAIGEADNAASDSDDSGDDADWMDK